MKDISSDSLTDTELVSLYKKTSDLKVLGQLYQRYMNGAPEITKAAEAATMSLKESYKSLMEALVHGGIANEVQVDLDCIEAEKIEQEDAETLLKQADGILIPGGFGDRGSEGKIAAIRYARENRIPFFGICLGMEVEMEAKKMRLLQAVKTKIEPEKLAKKKNNTSSKPQIGG